MFVFLSVPWFVSEGAGSDLPAYVSLADIITMLMLANLAMRQIWEITKDY